MITATAPVARPAYPVVVTGRLDDHLSRWLWLVKWVLVLPHVLVLAVLWPAFVVLSVAALVAIVATGRYPRVLFAFNVGVLRWTWRVLYYAYGALGTDRYPPFTLADRPDYPARFDVAYPEHLSRGLALVKWWLLALPHYVIVGLFVGGGVYAFTGDDGTTGLSLIGALVLFAGVVLLIRGSYPRSIFDLVLGLNRWALRVQAYAGLMTDEYPPFRLDMGGADPAAMTVSQPPPAAGPAPSAGPPPPQHAWYGAPARPPGRGWSAGAVTAVVAGTVAMLLGLGLGAGGGALLLMDGPGRDADGFVSTGTDTYSTTTAAMVTRLELPVEGPDWFYGPEQLGTLRLQMTSGDEEPVFVGIARREDAARFLDGVRHDDVVRPGPDPQYATVDGGGVARAPAENSIWVASATGVEEQALTWRAAEGDWAVVALNADGSPGVTATVRAGATLPHLGVVGWWLLGGGVALLLVGVVVVAAAARTAATPR
jgi:hypothetical protein